MIQPKVQAIIALVGIAFTLSPVSSAVAAQYSNGGYARSGGHSYAGRSYSHGGHYYGGHYGYGYGWPVFGLVVGTAAAIVAAPFAIASAAANGPYYGPPPAYYNAPPGYGPPPPQYAPSGYGAPPVQYAPPGYYNAPPSYYPAPQNPNQPDSGEYYDNGR